MKLGFAILLAAALLGGIGYRWLAPSGPEVRPDIRVTSLEGGQLDLADYQGRPLLVTFWATTCPGCLREMPHLIELYREFSLRGLEVVAIAMDYDPPSHVLAVREARRIPYPVALDFEARAARAFGDVRLTPTSFLIAPDGRIVERTTGELDFDRLRRQILALLPQARRDGPCIPPAERSACSG